jgi:hypothetical protein
VHDEASMTKKTVTRYDATYFDLACGHDVILGRLKFVVTWKCETCGKVTDFRNAPYKTALAQERDTADELDRRARERGDIIVRAPGATW